MIISLIIGFILMIILTVIILIPFLIKREETKISKIFCQRFINFWKCVHLDKPAILRWNSEGVTVAGVTSTIGSAANLLYYPYDLVVDWSYSLFVADRNNNRIQKFLRGSSNATTVAGRANGITGSTADAFDLSGFLLVDDDNNIHISDVSNNRVMFWKKDAVQGTIAAGNGTLGNSDNQLDRPHGLTYDRQSNILFVSDFGNHRIMKYFYNNSTGIRVAGNNICGTSTVQLCRPHALFFEQSSNSLLIANYGTHNIVRWFLNDTQWSIVIGDSNGIPGNSSSLLRNPTDVTLDPMNNIYVVDRSNHRVQFFPVGQSNATTIAGKTGMVGSNATLLRNPNSITFDNQLNLYVVDWQNHRIQKFLRY